MHNPINVLNEIMKHVEDVESVVDAVKRYSSCMDVDYDRQVMFEDGVIDVRNGDVYIMTPYIAIHCDPYRCFVVIDVTSYIVFKEGRIEVVHLLNQYYGIWRREELEKLFDTLKRAERGLMLAIEELKDMLAQLKSALAEARLLCS
jgi:hypothetical protein